MLSETKRRQNVPQGGTMFSITVKLVHRRGPYETALIALLIPDIALFS